MVFLTAIENRMYSIAMIPFLSEQLGMFISLQTNFAQLHLLGSCVVKLLSCGVMLFFFVSRFELISLSQGKI